jgi:predicted hotdog family 3-hydroxylacyl-ACP dehydratase
MIHQPPMLLIDEILDETSSTGITSFEVKKDCIFVDENGEFLSCALIEIAAQSFAAVDIYQRKERGQALKKGFLAMVRDFVFLAAAKMGDKIICEIEQVDVFDKLHFVKAKLTNAKDSRIFAQGEIRIYEID